MSRPRIVVFAYSSVGHACLKTLLDKKEHVVAVYTHQDDPQEVRWFPSVRELAEHHGIPVFTEDDFRSLAAQERVKQLQPDLLFSFYYRNLIPSAVLAMASKGAFNMHGSLLPKYRGRAPINWAILNGETETGATLHVMTEKADAGDIVDQEGVSIGPDDTASFVQANVTQAAVRVLERQIENLKKGCAPRTVQNHELASTYGRRRPEDGQFDWSWPARRIHNLIRALSHPYPGAYADWQGHRYFFWRSQVVSGGGSVDNGRLLVSCGDGGLLEILRLQKVGGKEMTGSEFLRDIGATKKELV